MPALEDKNNRRRFFRIVDSLGVSYQVIGKEEGQPQTQDNGEPQAPTVDTFSIVKSYSEIIENALEKIRVNDEHTAIAIEQLNKKVDALLMMMELDSVIGQRVCHRVEEASISASGIAFPIEEELQANTVLALDLLLKPSSKHINAVGNVVSCDRLNDESLYYLRVEFTEMSYQDREVLIQHIVQRQGSLLRSLRDEVEE